MGSVLTGKPQWEKQGGDVAPLRELVRQLRELQGALADEQEVVHDKLKAMKAYLEQRASNRESK